MMAKGSYPNSRSSFVLAISLLLFASNSTALDIVGRYKAFSSHPLLRRDASGSFGNGSLALSNIGDVEYLGNVNLGGKNFDVLIDTGSVDLYVVGDPGNTKDLDIPVNLTYGDGSVVGSVSTAELQFDGYTVEDQAFLKAKHSDDTLAGVLGLGPSTFSTIKELLNSSAGDPALDRIFRQNTSTPNYITFLLSRNASSESSVPLSGGYYPGQLTIGTVIPGLEAVNNAPKLPALQDGDTYIGTWLTMLDANGIIGPDGQKINTTTIVKNVTAGTENQLRTLLDTGTSLPQLPAYIADSIYGAISGATFIQNGADLHPYLRSFTNFWRVPCDQEVNATFIFGGQEFPIAPLDLTSDIGLTDRKNVEICFQQTDASISGDAGFGAFDMILGMAFLRNSYALFNYGDFVDGSTANTAAPYIQLLSISDKAKIHQDFVNARLTGGPSTGNSGGSNSGSTTGIPEILASVVSALVIVFGAVLL
ncbi:hypothetical protein D9758_002639 [Tetrapyrgos nigripes]|uniref:Peptidase A1 domain-containing protein n=1 Tax=Tetrapyrgos nigripes TaxID=182062 RepID=A0A8H5LTY6_9AGAR|nr:hypothetical protein D9758_002639 [Tetrapyrgos nigripes]